MSQNGKIYTVKMSREQIEEILYLVTESIGETPEDDEREACVKDLLGQLTAILKATEGTLCTPEHQGS